MAAPIEICARLALGEARDWADVREDLKSRVEAAGVRWRDGFTPEREPCGELVLGPAPPVRVRLDGASLAVRARTTPWGPGYHQRALTALDALSEVGCADWELKDPTGYGRERDLVGLREAYVRWAQELWSSPDQIEQTLLEPPARVPPGMCASPLGLRELTWAADTEQALSRLLNGDGAALLRPVPTPARRAFLWWEAQPDAYDLIQLGRALCANQVIWRPMTDERGQPDQDTPAQVEARERALACFTAALELDPAAPVPRAVAQRLCQLLEREEEAHNWGVGAGEAQDDVAGGYRDGWVRRRLAGRWQVELPGWLRTSVACSDHHDVFWDDALTVHVSLLGDLQRGLTTDEELQEHLDGLPADERPQARVERLSDPAAAGFAVVVPGSSPRRHSLIQGLVGGSCHKDWVSFTVATRSAAAEADGLRVARSLRPLHESQTVTR